MQKTSIEWTTFSANPLKYHRKSDGKTVWACVKTSPGCAHCYSEAVALRFERGKLFNAANMEGLEPFLDDAELRKMLGAKTVGGVQVSGSRCFVGDMTDLFGPWVPDELLDRLFAVFALRPDVTFQVLTKRADRMAEYASTPGIAKRLLAAQRALAKGHGVEMMNNAAVALWPLPNVWLGVSVEDQARADERIPHLLRTPAAVRFLSCEPLLGELNLRQYFSHSIHCAGYRGPDGFDESNCNCGRPHVHWVIVGGESGPGSRPCGADWVRSLVRQCREAAVPCFVKQMGANVVTVESKEDIGPGHPLFTMKPFLSEYEQITEHHFRDPKGGDMSEWPEDLRVRQFPQTTR